MAIKEAESGVGWCARPGKWPREHARKVLRAWQESGTSLSAFGRQHGIHGDRVRWWRDQFEREDRSGAQRKIGRRSKNRSPALLPVVIRPRPEEATATTVVLGCGKVIDPVWVATFVRELFANEPTR